MAAAAFHYTPDVQISYAYRHCGFGIGDEPDLGNVRTYTMYRSDNAGLAKNELALDQAIFLAPVYEKLAASVVHCACNYIGYDKARASPSGSPGQFRQLLNLLAFLPKPQCGVGLEIPEPTVFTIANDACRLFVSTQQNRKLSSDSQRPLERRGKGQLALVRKVLWGKKQHKSG